MSHSAFSQCHMAAKLLDYIAVKITSGSSSNLNYIAMGYVSRFTAGLQSPVDSGGHSVSLGQDLCPTCVHVWLSGHVDL